jgi:hypothetical protein
MLYEQAPQLAYRYRDFTIALRKETVPSRGDPYTAWASFVLFGDPTFPLVG